MRDRGYRYKLREAPPLFRWKHSGITIGVTYIHGPSPWIFVIIALMDVTYECIYWYNARLSGLYALGPDGGLGHVTDYHRVIFTAAEPGQIRFIVAAVIKICDRGIVSVISGRSVSTHPNLRYGDGHCYFSGDLNVPLHCESGKLASYELVQIIYPNISGKYWEAPSPVNVDADFVQVRSTGEATNTFNTPPMKVLTY